ncbi:substrate-binding periplasmic protein [Catenovulum maritimum]|uniref:Uncharacterized protein n=1 Tax=Catenovulum maritimum TaxID=1513271 RepID=A0A0J8GR33_9ALTE|nr:transporter substrate-binding domain-containing protein [Catenovulum maritimum]KMT65162.1 hypothetical protein XM47_10520 [Catenovulum maritimum]
MLRNIFNIWMLSLIVVFVMSSSQCFAQQSNLPALKIATFVAPPWVEQNKQGLSGISIEQLNQIQTRLPFKLEIQVLPAPRAFSLAEKEQLKPVAVYPCSATSQRAPYFAFSEQIKGGTSAIFTLDEALHAEKPNLDALEKQQNLVIGTLRGHALENELKQRKMKYVSVLYPVRLYKMLLLGRIDLAYSYKESFANNIAELPAEDVLKIKSYDINSMSYGFCFAKNNSVSVEYLKHLNSAIKLIP